ncbi:hypothetical protein SY83_16370 [Paenibacillus swuensis]|uniref:DUF3243 domain-containing protein n=1 Tax=Paenibacillus swuensis TaxID=1178515 RepID=A0A172TKU7_9BACL|nr:DUF3243 domain-containing protein [Paenibacillus swuensis]ANE47596.1 hypothetical protein SY83_16370 [Paenibacillus swuensis]
MSVLSNFDNWKQFLGNRVEAAHKAGMNDDTIANLAYEIGEFLDEKINPKNDEERVLKELWDVGDQQDRHTMAKLMVKLAENNQ